ncbi:probable tRNA-splicing endonuclease subunit sen54 isoform X2 [Agrilus planipennis]|uniref:Probable tRNA-splicing endonuclease subunit sen54 isoform X2 n=1 Tax=Agrilus planipennis TaxID=224129 RepID=A0A1W4XBL4_AGRPL|nr:probable tRNA-splicing endonuclease subunit sen54 isoform X2 [Agrilus planipennis]
MMNQWVAQLFEFHRNLVKDETSVCKNFIPINNEKEKQDTEAGLKNLHGILEVQRVDRRSARLKGNWKPETKLTLVTKPKGCFLRKLGFQNKTGYYLYPEEAIYLIETNRLEVLWKTITMSIQQAYSVLLPIMGIDKYLTYRKLISNGFKITIQPKELKRTLPLENEELKTKKICQRSQEFCGNTSCESNVLISDYADNRFRDIFANLRMRGPKKWTPTVKTDDVAYTAKLSDNLKIKAESYKVFVW